MSLEELIMEEPEKLTKEELDKVYEAYKVIEKFCKRVQEISIYNLDDKSYNSARDLQRQLKLHLKLLLRAILNETFCYNDALNKGGVL